MLEVVKSPLAENDLLDIWEYSYNKWGADQATEYLLQLESGMQGLTSNPNIGKSRNAVRDGYRSIQINRHVIYYRLKGGAYRHCAGTARANDSPETFIVFIAKVNTFDNELLT